MKVEYNLTLEDAVTFFRFHQKARPRQKGEPSFRGLLLWMIFFGLFLLVMLLARLGGPFTLSWLDAVLLVLFLSTAFLYFFGERLALRAALKRWRSDPRFFETRSLTISPEGVTASDSTGTVTTRWHAVVGIAEHDGRAFFYITEGSAHVLPKDAFADEWAFREFVETARRYQREAGEHIRPTPEGRR